MGIFDFLKRGTRATLEDGHKFIRWIETGIKFEFAQPLAETNSEALLDVAYQAGADALELGIFLDELASRQKCEITESGALVSWDCVYDLIAAEDTSPLPKLFQLPELAAISPIIGHRGSLSDAEFSLSVRGWTNGTSLVKVDSIHGAIVVLSGVPRLMPAAAWRTLREVERFESRPAAQRTQHQHELAWGRIRRTADEAGALYEDVYLQTTFVITPESLRLPLTKQETTLGRVTTVAPSFDGAPEDWLSAFDRYASVQSHYDFTRNGGRLRVVLSEPVQKVLKVIKREMPGRRVAGSKAERFIHNPWAFLGEAAHEVLKEEDYQRDRADAGAVAAIFNVVGRFQDLRLTMVELCVTEHFADGRISTDNKKLESVLELEDFASALETALKQEREQFPWGEYDLTIDAESSAQLELAHQYIGLWKAQPQERIALSDIYELAHYSGRIDGIGKAEPIYVPVFQKPAKEDSTWTPSDLTPMVKVMLQGHEGEVLIPLSKEWVKSFGSKVKAAEQNGASEVKDDALPSSVPTQQARALLDGFESMIEAEARVKVDAGGKRDGRADSREVLLVKTNFNDVDYVESHRESLEMPSEWSARLPHALRPSIKLKEHQLYGIAWFQNLLSKSAGECGGALLADDMGLGKTVQLLSVIGKYYEDFPDAPPSMVLAPKSLLENWKGETEKFFTEAFPTPLVLYGDNLRGRRQPLSLIDDELREKGIVELLAPDWAGNHKLIITTYEVLTSFEFSFAKQQFAFVICDEAQRIKTPGTLVTLAAKKLKAEFRVACTGTPVENSLADLWCLFDFVQPGLLGALKEFGDTYRRPIECDSEQLREAVQLLQGIISPQTLRRTKASIAADLKKKYWAIKTINEAELRFTETPNADERLELSMSEHQRVLYKAGLNKLQQATNEGDSRKRARMSFGALHLMKAVCAEPYCLPGAKFAVDAAGKDAHLKNSPKMSWLLQQLTRVKAAGEKAIVFTEIRQVQVALSHFLREQFEIKPIIIHGESEGRQASIEAFSKKSGFDVIILSTLAAGAGLNVTAANHVFHFTRAWNPAKEAQATDRAYRIGQERDVYVYCPTVVADFNTFEHRLDALLKQKSSLAGAALDKGGIAEMLNGSGGDAKMSEFIQEENFAAGAAIQKRILTMLDVDRMDGYGFEHFCAMLWKKQGYDASVTKKRPGDGGVDVVALKGKKGFLLQCKSAARGSIGWDAIKEVAAGSALYSSRYPKTQLRLLAVTNQVFNSEAEGQAKALRVEMVVRKDLEELMSRFPITNHEFEDAIQEASGIVGLAA